MLGRYAIGAEAECTPISLDWHRALRLRAVRVAAAVYLGLEMADIFTITFHLVTLH